LPPVNRLYQELRPRGLEVLLVDFREDLAHVRQVVAERGYVAPVLLDRSGDVTGRQYGVWGPPTVYVIDRAGQLVGHAIGARSWDGPVARDFLLALLAAPPHGS
jgi:cytochrome c biogenesis protein CcmG, thiol:disulfide interchange protein DsbE